MANGRRALVATTSSIVSPASPRPGISELNAPLRNHIPTTNLIDVDFVSTRTDYDADGVRVSKRDGIHLDLEEQRKRAQAASSAVLWRPRVFPKRSARPTDGGSPFLAQATTEPAVDTQHLPRAPSRLRKTCMRSMANSRRLEITETGKRGRRTLSSPSGAPMLQQPACRREHLLGVAMNGLVFNFIECQEFTLKGRQTAVLLWHHTPEPRPTDFPLTLDDALKIAEHVFGPTYDKIAIGAEWIMGIGASEWSTLWRDSH